MSYNKKVTSAGNYIEIKEYEKAQGDVSEMVRKGRSAKADEIAAYRNRLRSLRRAQDKVEKIIYANAYMEEGEKKYPPKSITLTYRENQTDLNRAVHDFANFIKRMEYHLKIKLRYIAVPAFQKRGAIHFHIITFNMRKVNFDIVEALWRNGSVEITTAGNLQKTTAYFKKNMFQAFEDQRMGGRKAYLSSHALVAVQSHTSADEVKYFEDLCKSGQYQKIQAYESSNCYTGKYRVVKYKKTSGKKTKTNTE